MIEVDNLGLSHTHIWYCFMLTNKFL